MRKVSERILCGLLGYGCRNSIQERIVEIAVEIIGPGHLTGAKSTSAFEVPVNRGVNGSADLGWVSITHGNERTTRARPVDYGSLSPALGRAPVAFLFPCGERSRPSAVSAQIGTVRRTEIAGDCRYIDVSSCQADLSFKDKGFV